MCSVPKSPVRRAFHKEPTPPLRATWCTMHTQLDNGGAAKGNPPFSQHPHLALSRELQLSAEQVTLWSIAFCRNLVNCETGMPIWQSISSKQSTSCMLQLSGNAEQFMLILLHQDLALEKQGNSYKQNQTIVLSLKCHFLPNQQEKLLVNGMKCFPPRLTLLN